MYKSLDTIPYKLFVKIIETNDFCLLADEDKEFYSFEENEKLKSDHNNVKQFINEENEIENKLKKRISTK